MVYTEIKNKSGRKYYYRVLSIRNGKKFAKKRKYLGVDLFKKELIKKEKEADKELMKEKNKKIERNLKKIKSKIIPILKKNKVKRAGIFGSYARGEQKKKSDIDVLVDIRDCNMSLLGFIGLKLKLEEALKTNVDLVEYSTIKPLIKNQILMEEIKIL